MKKMFILLALITYMCECHSQEARIQAIKKCNEAVKLYEYNFKKENIKAAIPLLKESLNSDSTFMRAYICLAECLSLTGNTGAAIETLDNAIAADTTSYIPYMLKGMLLMKEKKTAAEGRKLIDKALYLNKTTNEIFTAETGLRTLRDRVVIYSILGDNETAHTLFRKERGWYNIMVYNNKNLMDIYDMTTKQSEHVDGMKEIMYMWNPKYHPAPIAPPSNDDKIYRMAEVPPRFPGGDNAMLNFINKNIIFPDSAIINRVEGRVIIEFVVKKDGSLDNINVHKSLSPETDKEAVRVIKSMPDWIPAIQNGKSVNMRCYLPIMFKYSIGNAKIPVEGSFFREEELKKRIYHSFIAKSKAGEWEYGIPKDTVKHIILMATELIAINPAEHLRYQILMQCYNALGDYDKAMDVADKWEEALPGNVGVTILRGYTSDLRDRRAEADGYYRKALDTIDKKKLDTSTFLIKNTLIGLLEGEESRTRFVKQTLGSEIFSDSEKSVIKSSLDLYESREHDRAAIVRRVGCGAPVNLSGQNSAEEKNKAENFFK